MIGEQDAVVVIFGEQQVRHCKTAHFLKRFGRDALPDGPELAALMGKFQFLVEGWDHNLSGYKRVGEPQAKVEYDPMDLLNFIPKNFVPLNEMMMRAGMSEMDIYNRTRDVFHHFHLPYDAPPL